MGDTLYLEIQSALLSNIDHCSGSVKPYQDFTPVGLAKVPIFPL